MWYLIMQIIFCLLAAFLLGLFIGYLLWKRDSYQRSEVEKLENTWKANIASKEEEITRISADLAECRENLATDTSPAMTGGGGPLLLSVVGGAEKLPKDELQRIWGVGPYLERKLNEFGITAFRQIAALTREDVQKLSTTFNSFRDRVERDNWLEQARKLHKEKYNEDL